ncbi:MAG: NAD-dependent epimerase/dehydratase family protein, partial [Myxococcota bacterium]|nr:NAD-dependent epimerase/dehydratase family protein [Myxococcota bacterium]
MPVVRARWLMKVVITGSSGQLGSLVARRLLDSRKTTSVVGYDLRLPAVASAKFVHVSADIRGPEIENALNGADCLVHLAFVVSRSMSRAEMNSINFDGSTHVFRAAARAKVRTIVYSSSVAAYGVYGDHPSPIVEDTPRRYQAGFGYAATKYRVEEFLDGFAQEHPEIAIARLRPGLLLGRAMDNPLGRALRRRVVFAAGSAPLPIVWDDDVAAAVAGAALQQARGAYNLVATNSLTPEQLAASASMRMQKMGPRTRAAVVHGLRWIRAMGVRAMDPAWLETADVQMAFSSRKAREGLGWNPECPTAEDVIRRFAREVPHRADRHLAAYFRLVALKMRLTKLPAHANNSVPATIHLVLTGASGGEWTIKCAGQDVRVTHGLERPPTAVITLPAK